jgi:hypothetical protein
MELGHQNQISHVNTGCSWRRPRGNAVLWSAEVCVATRAADPVGGNDSHLDPLLPRTQQQVIPNAAAPITENSL